MTLSAEPAERATARLPPASSTETQSEFSRRARVVCLHGFAVVVVASFRQLTEDDALVLYGGGILMGAVFPLLALVEARSSTLRLTPLSFLFGWITVGFGPSAIYTGWQIDSQIPLLLGPQLIDPHDCVAGYIIYLFGTWVMHVGIQLSRPTERAGDSSVPATMTSFALLWTVGVILRLANLQFSIAATYAWGTLAALSGVAISSSIRGALSSRRWALLVVGTCIEFTLNIRTGSKAFMMLSFIPLMWPLVVVPSLRRWIVPIFGVFVVVYFGIVFPVVSTTRAMGTDASKTDPVSTFYSVLSNGAVEDGSSVDDPADSFLRRHFDSGPMGYIYGEVERNGYLNGSGLDYLIYAFVPRFLWPEKPIVSRGAWFTYQLGQANSPEEATTSTGQSSVGELYWNFGIPGVAVGMAVIGAAIGLLWRIATTRPFDHPLKMLLFILLLFNMIDEPEAGAVIVGLIFRFFAVGVPIVLLTLRQRPEGRQLLTSS
jgi:hypothetical protein